MNTHKTASRQNSSAREYPHINDFGYCNKLFTASNDFLLRQPGFHFVNLGPARACKARKQGGAVRIALLFGEVSVILLQAVLLV